jgi:hypothetical protein
MKHKFTPKTNPRFVWAVGAIEEQYPDMCGMSGPQAYPGTVLWDRQEQKPAVTIAPGYGNLFCLETTRSEASQPFTNLENWLNNMAPGDLSSEGVSETI